MFVSVCLPVTSLINSDIFYTQVFVVADAIRNVLASV